MSFGLDYLLNEVSRGFADIERQYGGKKAKEPPELTVHEFDNPDPVAPTASASINDAFRRVETDASIPGIKILSPALEEQGDARLRAFILWCVLTQVHYELAQNS